MPENDTVGVKTTRTSFAIVEAVDELDGPGVSELARHLDRSKGGIYKHLQTMTDLGYLRREGDTYHLGIELWLLGASVRDRFLDEQITSVIDDLAASIGHVVTLVIYESGTAAAVYASTPSEAAVQPYEPGDTLPLHASAAGKAILAYLPDDERKEVLGGDIEAYTDATMTDRDTIDAAIEEIRAQRLAREHGEYEPGVECVAAPIIESEGNPRGSVTVTSASEQLLDGRLEAEASLIVSASKSLENTLTG